MAARERILSTQIEQYCKSVGCKAVVGTFRENEDGITVTVTKDTYPDPSRFTKVKHKFGNYYAVRIAAKDYNNPDVTKGVYPFDNRDAEQDTSYIY